MVIFSFAFSIGIAQAAIVRVQKNTGSNDGTTNVVTSNWSTPTTSGDLLVAIVGFNSGSGAAVTPPAGPGWTSAVAVRSTNGTDDITTAIYYIPNAGSQSGSSTWTISNQAPGGYATLTLVEYSGVDPSNPLHTTGYATGNGALGDSGTTTPNYNAGEVAVAGITTASGNTNFSGETNSYTEESEIASILTAMAPGLNTAFEDRMPTLAAGNQGVQVTINGTFATPTWAWAGVIATFNPAAAAGGTDMCVNIAGDQTTVPAGYVADAGGNCVQTAASGTDVCTNIAGEQTTIPDGYVIDAAGDCVAGSGGDVLGAGLAPFTDISNSWASAYIQKLFTLEVVSGLTSTTFGPDQNLTRAQMVKIAMLAFGYQMTDGATPTFKDVNAGDWFAKYIAMAEKAGVVGGYANGTFMPNNNITRAEALKILLAAAAHAYNVQSDIFDRWPNNFTDVDQAAWYANYVNFAFANGIVNGKTSTMFAPNDSVTRAEMTKMAELATEKFLSALSHQPLPAPQGGQSNLRVQIVVETAPGVYAPIIAPQNTVISVDPGTGLGNGLIRCPTTVGGGVAFPVTSDCSELNVPSGSSIKLTAIPATIIPNATFYHWTDIQPFFNSNALTMTNGCIGSAYLPNITCPMTFSGMVSSRELQAVYKCNDTFTYNSTTQKCEKPSTLRPCDLYFAPNPSRTDCGLHVSITRANTATNDYKVTVSQPTALPHPPSAINVAPSSPSSCVNLHNTLPGLGCIFFYTVYPTPITLTASATNNAGVSIPLPTSFKWTTWAGGPCNNSTSPTCTISIVKDPVHPMFGLSNGVTASF